MNKKVSNNLLALSSIDEQLLALITQKKSIESRQAEYREKIRVRRDQLGNFEGALKEGAMRQGLEEHRLKDEEQKIVERRKKLSDVGGAKVGKILEREIDIASRALNALEERTMRAIEEVDTLSGRVKTLQEDLQTIEQQFENENQDWEKQLQELNSSIKSVLEEREDVAPTIDERLLRLYERVKNRYAGGKAVAVASEGSCRSCFRALPPQTYNQILAGNLLIQCPGCSRILVLVESTSTK